MKILSPVGNFDGLKSAVFNGADEIYLGINEFNARNNIDGFCFEDLQKVIDFAHIFNVKVLLAVNILFNDEELAKVVDMVVDAYNLGVDAFIIQDIGLADILHNNYPEIELHASTQMGVHNLEGALFAQVLGFKRVVLARETPLSEIKRIKQNTNLEIEYFVHGSLCVSFSGNCYLSSKLNNASGNRGRCKQLCRLPYVLQSNGKPLKSGYLLSAKDFDMSERIRDLQDAGVDVIKIEGRARRAFYVAVATAQYYALLNDKQFNKQLINLAFNRGFEQGYFNGNGNMISSYQNHIGIEVGKVEKCVLGKRFNEVYISSTYNVTPKSVFKFFDKGVEVDTVTAYDLITVKKGYYKFTTTHKLNVGQTVRLIVDYELEKQTLEKTKKRQLFIEIFARANSKLKAVVDCGDFSFEVQSEEPLSLAVNQPVTRQEFTENFKKSQLFDATISFGVLENVFLTKAQLNLFRRKVYDAAYEQFAIRSRKELKKVKFSTPPLEKCLILDDFEIITHSSQSFTKKHVIYSPEVYLIEDIVAVKNTVENSNKIFYLDTPNFALAKDVELLSDIIKKTNVKIVANNVYALQLNTDKIIGAGLNVYNKATATALGLPFVSGEGNVGNLCDFPYMTLRHCPIKSHLNGSCDNCSYTKGLVYKMESGVELLLKRKKLATCTFYLHNKN